MVYLSIFIFLCLFLSADAQQSYFSDAWSMLSSDRPSSDKCIEIPKAFSLCYGIQYNTMRLPNLLDHETIDEVIEQSAAWQSLVQLHCNPNTQLFLCSLFAPICLPNLDKPIEPCRSLCEQVQENCENRMQQYGFPWPEMLRCDRFENNDMCIKPIPTQTSSSSGTNQICKSCSQASTFENILDNFCRSSLVLRARIRPLNSTHVIVKKAKIFKGSKMIIFNEKIIKITDFGNDHCQCPLTKGIFLLMADESSGEFVTKLILPWKQEKIFKNAIRRFKAVNCTTLGREIRESVLRQTYKRTPHH